MRRFQRSKWGLYPSQSAAAFLNEKGFDEVYSLDGGFEYWRGCFEQDTTREN